MGDEWTEEQIVIAVPVTLEYDPTRIGKAELVAHAERGLTNALQHIAGYYRIEGGEAASMSQWIPVEERLPEDGVWVLWFSKSWSQPPVVAKRDGESLDWGGDLCCTLRGFTHWMPLPEPPEVR